MKRFERCVNHNWYTDSQVSTFPRWQVWLVKSVYFPTSKSLLVSIHPLSTIHTRPQKYLWKPRANEQEGVQNQEAERKSETAVPCLEDEELYCFGPNWNPIPAQVCVCVCVCPSVFHPHSFRRRRTGVRIIFCAGAFFFLHTVHTNVLVTWVWYGWGEIQRVHHLVPPSLFSTSGATATHYCSVNVQRLVRPFLGVLRKWRGRLVVEPTSKGLVWFEWQTILNCECQLRIAPTCHLRVRYWGSRILRQSRIYRKSQMLPPSWRPILLGWPRVFKYPTNWIALIIVLLTNDQNPWTDRKRS